jgi:hypothetical protein
LRLSFPNDVKEEALDAEEGPELGADAVAIAELLLVVRPIRDDFGIPRNASTWPAIPLMALRKMRGRAWRHGCWQGSFTLSVLIANWRNFCVWLITSGLVRLMGLPMVFKKRYQLWAIQSFDIP